MKLHYLSSLVVAALLVRVSEAVPLPLSSSSSSRQLTHHDLLDALEVLQTWLKNIDDGNVITDWRRVRRSQPPDWLGTNAAGTAWDAYVRMLRQEQLGLSELPRRTSNPVNFLGKRASYFK